MTGVPMISPDFSELEQRPQPAECPVGHGGHGIRRPTRDVGGLLERVIKGVAQPEHLALFVSESIEGLAQVSEVRTVT